MPKYLVAVMSLNNDPTRFETALSSITDAVIVVGDDYMVEWVNSAAEQLTGISQNRLKGHDLSLIFPKDSHYYDSILSSIDLSTPLTDHEGIIETIFGSAPVMLSVHPIETENGGGAVVALRNLTGLKALERAIKLEERVSEISALAAGIAHEIKNPLSGIRGSAQLLGMEVNDQGSRDLVDLMIKEVDRIDRMISGLIKLNQADDFPRLPTNIYSTIDDVLQLLGPALDEKGVMVKKSFDPSLPSVLGDPDRLKQIFLNLIKNAVEATDNEEVIELWTGLAWKTPPGRPSPKGNPKSGGGHSKYHHYAHIKIIDNGPGLDTESLPYIFTPFFSKKSSGSGLGLPITLQLIRAHGGMLEIGNRAGGVGAVASVYLPYEG